MFYCFKFGRQTLCNFYSILPFELFLISYRTNHEIMRSQCHANKEIREQCPSQVSNCNCHPAVFLHVLDKSLEYCTRKSTFCQHKKTKGSLLDKRKKQRHIKTLVFGCNLEYSNNCTRLMHELLQNCKTNSSFTRFLGAKKQKIRSIYRIYEHKFSGKK